MDNDANILTNPNDSPSTYPNDSPHAETQTDDSSPLPTTAALPNATPSLPPCPACTRLSTTLPCCLSLPLNLSTSPCQTCLALDTALALQIPDAKTTRQIQEDRVESLKLATKELEAENKRVKARLDEKKGDLRGKVGELNGLVPRNEFRRRMKKVRKAGEGRKLPGEK